VKNVDGSCNSNLVPRALSKTGERRGLFSPVFERALGTRSLVTQCRNTISDLAYFESCFCMQVSNSLEIIKLGKERNIQVIIGTFSGKIRI
jgi:hypothetical protein